MGTLSPTQFCCEFKTLLKKSSLLQTKIVNDTGPNSKILCLNTTKQTKPGYIRPKHGKPKHEAYILCVYIMP